MNIPYGRRSHGQTGLTLVELMVALTIGLFLLAVVLGAFLAQRQSHRTLTDLARVQSSAQSTVELLGREIRESGVNLCGIPPSVITTVLKDVGTSPWYDWNKGGIEGFEGGRKDDAFATYQALPTVDAGTGIAQRVQGTDGLIIRSASLLDGATISAHPATEAPLSVNTLLHGFVSGNVLMACDYKSAAIFQATDTSAASKDIGHAKDIGTPGNGSEKFPDDYTFAPNGFLAPLYATAWYIGNNAAGGRSLYRKLNGGAPQEVARGVTDMQITYLTRTDSKLTSSYINASDIDSWATDADQTVVSVRVDLTLEPAEADGTEGEPPHLVNTFSRRGYRELP